MASSIIDVSDIVIRFSGDSGDGMQITGTLFSDTAALLGNSISTFPDYPAEIRAPHGTIAGVSGFQVHFGDHIVQTPGDYCDVLVAMNPAALKANAVWLKPNSAVIIDGDSLNEQDIVKAGYKTLDPIAELGIDDTRVIAPNITSLTKQAVEGLDIDLKTAVKCKNMFALGLCLYLFNKSLDYSIQFINNKFAKRDIALAEANVRALKAGFNYGGNTHAFVSTYNVNQAKLPAGKYCSINGNRATAWGFIAASEKSGRPLFCGSYPITPATVILEELAKRKDLGVKTVQAEDEIAGICTSIGAAFAGNFAVTTTSGPGLSLKSEAMGLAVITELPLVVVDVQRGGPSTGLPTKTEQSDLLQALWGRNGECPMIVVAASSPSDCFHYAFWSGKLAMEHMTPVLLLTDGFIANGREPWLIPSMKDYPAINPPVATKKEDGEEKYLTYKRDAERLARRWAIPGTAGLEHRVGGLEKDFLKGSPSHNPANHQKMVDIRAEKVAKVAEFLPVQEVIGAQEGDLLVVGWGGTKGHLMTAMQQAQREHPDAKIGLAHFNFINPLPKGTEEILGRFKKILVCELNSGQFADYLRMSFQQYEYHQFNRVEGLPFTVSDLVEAFDKELK